MRPSLQGEGLGGNGGRAVNDAGNNAIPAPTFPVEGEGGGEALFAQPRLPLPCPCRSTNSASKAMSASRPFATRGSRMANRISRSDRPAAPQALATLTERRWGWLSRLQDRVSL